jgi:hypothetical protein
MHDIHLRLLGVQAPDKQPAKNAATKFVTLAWPPGSDLVVHTVRDSKDREITTFERWMAIAYDQHSERPIADLLIETGHAVAWNGQGARPDL